MMTASISFKKDASFNRELNKARRKGLTGGARLVQKEARRGFTKKAQAGTPKGASRPGALPKRRSGNYSRSIKYTVNRNSNTFIGPTQPKGNHAGVLKYGTSKMKPRAVPVVEALRKVQSKVTDLFKGKL